MNPEREQESVDEGDFDGIPFTRIVCNYRFETFEETYRRASVEEIFHRVLARERPDVLHLQHLQTFSVGVPRLAHRLGIPVVFTLHEYHLLCLRGGQLIKADLTTCREAIPEICARCLRERQSGLEIERRGPNPEAEAVSARLAAMREMAEDVDQFVSPSAFLRDLFVRSGYPPDRIRVSDNGLDATPFREARARRRAAASPVRFGFVGSIVDYKGVHVAIEAFDGLEADGWELLLFGKRILEGDHARYVASLERLATNPRIRFRGAFAPDEVGKIYAELDVLVVPSLWFENSPLTIHEAFLAGIPVIASDQGGMAELIREEKGGLLFRTGDASDLRRKALRILVEPGLRERLAANAPPVKSIEENARELEELYAQLGNRRRGGFLKRWFRF